MAKRSTDLLDVFRQERGAPARGGSGSRRGRKGRGDRRWSLADFQGIFLGPRQLLLVVCVLVLLFVLSFTVGLGIGRRGAAPSDGGTALQRTIDGRRTGKAWCIQGRMAKREGFRREAPTRERIAADLGLSANNVWIEEGEGDYYVVSIGPFGSEAEARRYHGQYNLEYMRVQDSYPFAFAKILEREAP